MTSLEEIAHNFPDARVTGNDVTIRCPNPNHNGDGDQRPSFAFFVGKDGRAHGKCFAGCSREDWFPHLPSEIQTLLQPPRTVTDGLTIAGYAKAKKFPEKFLREDCHVRQVSGTNGTYIVHAYRGADGMELCAQQQRALEGPDKFRFPRGSKLTLMGLDHLADHPRDEVTLVEGPSDTYTLLSHGINVLGLPSASYNPEPHIPLLAEFKTIFVCKEPDQGGETILKSAWIRDPRLKDKMRLIFMPESTKDAHALYMKTGSLFGDSWRTLKAQSIPLSAYLDAETQKRKAEAWAACSALAKEPDILECFAQDNSKKVKGETKNLKLIYLALVARLLSKPVNIAVKGPSGSGKNYILQSVLDYFPPSAYYRLTASSERALIYDPEPLAHRVLVMAEASGIKEGFGAYVLRSLLSEGSLTYVTVEKTDAGIKARTVRRPGPTALFTTTCEAMLDRELETRILSIETDDTVSHTKDIFRSLAERQDS